MGRRHTVRVIICEDEKYWNDILKASVTKWAESRKTELQCNCFYSPKELINYFVAHSDADAIFLDISLGNEMIDGMATAKQIRKMGNHVPIIFVTVDSARAVDGYLVEAMGFLCKPIDEKRLSLFLDRILKRKKNEKMINFSSESELIVIPQSDVIYAEVINHTIHYHTRKREIKIRGTLTEIIDMLGTEDFIQIHRSFIISKSKINKVKATYPYLVDLLDGNKTVALSVGRKYINKLIEAYSDDVLEMMI